MNTTPNDTATPEQPAVSFPFRWSYIVLPLCATGLTIVLTAVFYGLLPDDVMYRLQDDPDAIVSRSALAMWLVIPQVLFALASFVLVKIILAAARYASGDSSLIKRILPLVGNMTAILQFILLFAAVQIFLYNAYEVQTGPLWLPVLVIAFLGGIIILVRFFGLFLDTRRQKAKTLQE